MDFQNVLQDLPLFVNYARKEDFQTAQRPTDRGGGGIGDFKKLVIAKYGKISAAQKVRNWNQFNLLKETMIQNKLGGALWARFAQI